MSLNHTFKRYMPLLQDLHTQSKEFDVLTLVSYLAIGLLATLFLCRCITPDNGKGTIRKLGGFSIFTAWTFFTKRFDFIWANFGSDSHFKFKVLHHNVIALRGEEARKAYFDSRSLDTTEGYQILMGGAPRLRDINIEEKTRAAGVSSFNKHLAVLFNRNRLSDVLPRLFSDIDKRMETWGKHGRMDPFKTIYDLVFQMTVRMASCAELSDNFKAIEEIQALYWTLEKSATPTALLLPWFPGPAKKRKEQATKDLFIKVQDYVELRRNAAVPSSDAIDVLLEQGLPTADIVGFILSVIFAGVINTGINSCWALVYLAFHSDWKAKAKAEIDALVHKHTANSNEPLHKRLGAIHISAWEDEMPVIDLVIRETLRLSLSGLTLRRNLEEDITLSGGLVRPGDFVAYSLADVHLNPEIYSRPQEFDPARFAEGREEDKKGSFSYLAWGAGRHPCTGMRVAKLEIKIIVAFMLIGYEFGVVDKFGKVPMEIPKPNRNDIHQSRPIGEPCYLQFERTVE